MSGPDEHAPWETPRRDATRAIPAPQQYVAPPQYAPPVYGQPQYAPQFSGQSRSTGRLVAIIVLSVVIVVLSPVAALGYFMALRGTPSMAGPAPANPEIGPARNLSADDQAKAVEAREKLAGTVALLRTYYRQNRNTLDALGSGQVISCGLPVTPDDYEGSYYANSDYILRIKGMAPAYTGLEIEATGAARRSPRTVLTIQNLQTGAFDIINP